ncbi:MAG: PAS domain S-box protein, partial [Bacteroidota bacterium]
MIFINKSGRVVYANRKCEELTGYTRAEVCAPDFNFLRLIAPESIELVKANFGRHVKGEDIPPYEYALITKHGERLEGIHTTKLINYEGGSAILGIVTDITERKQAEEALRATEQKLRDIVEYSTNLFYSHTVDHVLTYVSPQSRHFLGCDPEEAKVRWTEFVTDHPVNLKGFESTQQAIDTGVPQPRFELELKTKGGKIVWVEVNEAPVVKEGKTIAIVGSLTDITERKQAEEALRLTEEKYRGIFEHAGEGIYQSTPEGKFIAVNPMLAQMLGYASAEELMAEVTDIERQLYVDQTARAGLRDLLEQQGYVKGLESRLYRKDGSTIWVMENARLVRNGDVYYEGTLQDITERRRTSEALHESEERYRSLVEMSPDAIGVHADGKFVYANAAMVRLLGASNSDELIGRLILDVVHPDYREVVKERVNVLKEEGKEAPLIEEKFLRLDGTVVDVEVAAIPFTYNGKPAVQVVVRDITGRNQAEREIRLLAQTVASTKDCVSITA